MERYMVELTEKQVQALNIIHAALVEIRTLARQPVTPRTMGAIYDLADALHNVPLGVTMRPESSMHASSVDHDIETAAGVFKREGFRMGAFPPDIQVRDADRSRYVASGATLSIPPGIANQYATVGTEPRGGMRLGSSLALFFRRIFG